MGKTMRQIVQIDRDKCNGCGACVPNCAEGAIQIIDGKATLVSETYCDGLGACLGTCPMDAITIVEREADAFNAEAVEQYLETKNNETPPARKPEPAPPKMHPSGGCPGSALRQMNPGSAPAQATGEQPAEPSQLSHWPVQLRLVPPTAPFLAGRDIVVSADCVPFAVPDFHQRYLAGRAALVACPKLDDLDFYREKLRLIVREAKPKSLTVLRMEVPCCAGIASAVIEARNAEAPDLPLEVHTVGVDGQISAETVGPM